MSLTLARDAPRLSRYAVTSFLTLERSVMEKSLLITCPSLAGRGEVLKRIETFRLHFVSLKVTH